MADKSELLFYSNRCQHSRAILDLLQSRGLLSQFMLVCVDTPKYALPPFVDRVPLVYRRQTRQVLTEASIPHFINLLASQGVSQQQQPRGQSQQQSQQSQQSQQQAQELMAYSDFVTNGKISDTFGFLDETVSSERANSSYNFIGHGHGHGPDSGATIETVSVERGSKFDQSSYDKYISNRDADLNTIRAAQPRPL